MRTAFTIAIVLLLCACQPWGASMMAFPSPQPSTGSLNRSASLSLKIVDAWPLTPIMLHEYGCKRFDLPPNVKPGHPVTVSFNGAQCFAPTYIQAQSLDKVTECGVRIRSVGSIFLNERGVDTDCKVTNSVWTYNLKKRYRPHGGE